MTDLIQRQHAYTAALRDGDEGRAQAVIAAARADGLEPPTIYLQIFAPSMTTIGALWEQNQLSVAEEHMATAITERLIGHISAECCTPAAGTVQHGGRVVMGCVANERHELGLRMLADLFRLAGWEVFYLGADVPSADWLQLAQRGAPDLIVIATTAVRYVPEVRLLIRQFRVALPDCRILVGGAAFDHLDDTWRLVGADLYHRDPLEAVARATADFHAAATHRPDQTNTEP